MLVPEKQPKNEILRQKLHNESDFEQKKFRLVRF